jgi:hypothetical protein
LTAKDIALFGDVNYGPSGPGGRDEQWFYDKRSPSVKKAFYLQLVEFFNNFIRKELLETLEIP